MIFTLIWYIYYCILPFKNDFPDKPTLKMSVSFFTLNNIFSNVFYFIFNGIHTIPIDSSKVLLNSFKIISLPFTNFICDINFDKLIILTLLPVSIKKLYCFINKLSDLLFMCWFSSAIVTCFKSYIALRLGLASIAVYT